MVNLNGYYQRKIDKFCLNSISVNSYNGYILDINFKYPDKLHELHNDYPLAPEKLKTNHNMVSNHCSSIAMRYGMKIGGANKLVPNLLNKNKHVLHYRNLKLHLSLEMKLTKVHRILDFKPSTCLKK